MADSVYCSQCGAPATAGAAFCQRCGSRMVAVAGPVASSSQASTAVVTAPYVTAVPVMPDSYYGGFWIRLVAYFIDQAVLGVVLVPVFVIFVLPSIITVIHNGGFDQDTPPPEFIWAIVLFSLAVFSSHLLYEIVLTSSSWQGTIGKKLLRLKVTDDFGNRISIGRSTGRFFAKILSGLASNIGFIMIAFMDRKRGLHDVIAKTQVLRY